MSPTQTLTEERGLPQEPTNVAHRTSKDNHHFHRSPDIPLQDLTSNSLLDTS